MEEERSQKIEAGRRKLAAYKKRKHQQGNTNHSESASTSSSRDSSLHSLSPENPDRRGRIEDNSDSSQISEHISSNGSMENDRSLQEIEISNIPGQFSLMLDSSLNERISQEAKPQSMSLSDNSVLNCKNFEVAQNVQSILEEILKNEQFTSDPEQHNKSEEASLNIFENLNLDDNSLNDYFRRRLSDQIGSNRSIGGGDCSDNLGEAYRRLVDMEELLTAKDTAIAALNAELDSVKEQSNLSTLSTSTTEYKQFQEEYHSRLVEFQGAIAHRDNLIQQLTESLQQSLAVRENLRQESEYFARQISELQKQLSETSDVLRRHKCGKTKKSDDTVDFLEKSEVEQALSDFSESEGLKSLNVSGDVKTAVKMKMKEFKAKCKQEIQCLKEKMRDEQQCHEKEISKLKQILETITCDPKQLEELKEQLDRKHTKEMEELRTYFEQKCADMEKHYSDEILSRKMSGSSSCSELTSDLLFSGSQPLPTGEDTNFDPNKLELVKREPNLTKHDLVKLKADLECVCNELSHYNLDKITKEELNTIKLELAKYDLRNLAKYDVTVLQNKYHAELEILREDYENRIDLLNLENEERLRSLERRYEERLEVLRGQLEEAVRSSEGQAVQEVGSSGEFELTDIVESYERRLQEQVTLAKFDLIAGLEAQIQRLAANEDEDWPEELLKLKDRFTERYESEISNLKAQHEDEMAKMKEEHQRKLKGALERGRQRESRDLDSLEVDELVKERDTLSKTTSVLRQLVSELLKYFTRCEDELNNTIIDELLKHGFDTNITQLECELDANKTRVHLTPDVSDFLKHLETSASLDSLDVSHDLKHELEACLDKLKSEANAVLALTSRLSVAGSDSGGRGLEDGLLEKVVGLEGYVKGLESEKADLERHLEEMIERQGILEKDLAQAKGKIVELIESGRKEIVSEGYGENVGGGNKPFGLKVASLSELQEKARAILVENAENGDQPLMRLLEELLRSLDEVAEEAKRDHDDLAKQVKVSQQLILSSVAKEQVEAADKKYKATCQFLEEQAAEREQEHDEAHRQITALKEQLREREKDRASCERVYSEVEQLEQQMREMSKLIAGNELRQQEVEAERKEAVEKIYILRDIIRDLEQQIEARTKTEAELRALVFELQEVVQQQSQTNAELAAKLGDGGRVAELEEEIERLRVNAELAGNEGALKELRGQLQEFEASLDKRTHDLEALHSTLSTTCSSPSEDMSIRDQIRPRTPASALDECDVPLQQLARLKEKLMRHTRAEDAAMKRIRDLEMQLTAIRRDLDEAQAERDALQEQVTEQLVVISSLQIRLDDQRLYAEDVQKQTNTSLEARIYDLETEIQDLKETVHSRDKTIKQLNNTLEHTKSRLEELQDELRAQKDDDVVAKLKRELSESHKENDLLRRKMETNAKSAELLPGLVDNIIADKNADLEKMREKLSDTEKQLQSFLSLNLTHEQIKSLSQLNVSDRALADMLSLMTERPLRAAESRCATLGSSLELNRRSETTPLEISEISSIEKPIDASKHVRFVDADGELSRLRNELSAKEELVKEYSGKIKSLVALEGKVEFLERTLLKTEEELKVAAQRVEDEVKKGKECERDLRVELAEKKVRLGELERKLGVFEEDSVKKDQMYINLAKEKRELEKEVQVLREEKDKYKEFERVLNEKTEEIYRLQERLADVISEADLDEMTTNLKNALEEKEDCSKRLEESLNKIKQLEETIFDKNCEIEILNEDLKHYQDEMDKHKVDETKKKISDLNKEVDRLRELLSEKDKIINQMSEDSENLRKNLEAIQNKIQETGNIIDLAKRLRDEQKLNVELQEEVHLLKATILSREEESDFDKEIEEITGKVEKELDFSAQLDSSILSALEQSQPDEPAADGHAHSDTLDALRQENARLERELAAEKQNTHEIQVEDARLLEQMRSKLDGLADAEAELLGLLEGERRRNGELEEELKRLRQEEVGEYKALPGAGEESELKVELKSVRRELREKEGRLADAEERERVLRVELGGVKEEVVKRRREVENSRALMDEMEQDMKILRKQLEKQNHRLNEVDATCELDAPLPEKISKKIKELSNLVKDNKHMTETLAKLTDERRTLQQRIKELENERNAPLPFTDPVARANHLFARYLRADSYRKALVWQKRYLLALLSEYQGVAPVTRYLKMCGFEKTTTNRAKPKGKERFKCVAVLVVSVVRMRNLVLRWHSGKRLAVGFAQGTTRRYTVPTPPRGGGDFQVGQPVSERRFRLGHPPPPPPPSSAVDVEVSWSGNTPPQKERARVAVQGVLRPPEVILARYADRFNELQRRLEFGISDRK